MVMKVALNTGESLKLNDAVFNVDFNAPLVHQVVQAYLSNGHSGTKAQKSRSDVRGGGAKPWRQKGSGRARAGTRNSPIWRGGGVTFATKPTVTWQKVNRKMYRGAMRCILSELMRQKRITITESFDIDQPKTKLLQQTLHDLKLQNPTLVLNQPSANLQRAVTNLKHISLETASNVNPTLLVAAEQLLIDVESIRALEARLA
ncbi:MAG: 50S ribosomal protein L4 [Gammaproteobacteria bacterium]|nr:50S ribosomal protein L4 [Gammaproteobacteria bacterium]MYF02604.1 50S ribosomal protein L4 [Gammaproteobacteria bacterium]